MVPSFSDLGLKLICTTFGLPDSLLTVVDIVVDCTTAAPSDCGLDRLSYFSQAKGASTSADESYSTSDSGGRHDGSSLASFWSVSLKALCFVRLRLLLRENALRRLPLYSDVSEVSWSRHEEASLEKPPWRDSASQPIPSASGSTDSSCPVAFRGR